MGEHTKLRAVDGGTTTPDEAAMLAAYRALKDVHRGHVLGMAQILAKDHPRPRPALTLVTSSSN